MTRTPYYQDDLVTLWHGDCLEVTEWLAADVLVADPPYGIGWTGGHAGHGHTAHGGIVNDDSTSVRDAALRLWTGPALVFGSMRAPFPIGWHKSLVFEKPVAVASGLYGNRTPWLANWEPVFVLGTWPDQVPSRGAVVRTRALAASGYSGYSTRAGHPHAKPLDVMEALIEACPPGTVADPFAGSGSTLVAAKALGRCAIGVELEERYCEIAARRLAQDAFDFGGVA